jgi:hypothetical protein
LADFDINKSEDCNSLTVDNVKLEIRKDDHQNGQMLESFEDLQQKQAADIISITLTWNLEVF